MSQLTGKVAIITGGSKGVGREFLRALVAEGMRVACLARPSPELTSLNSEFGGAVLAIDCDISAPAAVDRAVKNIAASYGQIDVVVNNAATYVPFAFEKGSDEIVRNHVEVNLLGVAWMIRATIPHLRKTRGQIVAISSESTVSPVPMLSLYAATKTAVETLCDGLRDELRDDGIRVSILRSGNIAGGTASAAWPRDVAESFYRKLVATGHAARSGASASAESMACALIAILSLPRDISADLSIVRAANQGVPQRVLSQTDK
jgi:NADP-dependent 3-hydroxy acid dehydrogenase YdfG